MTVLPAWAARARSKSPLTGPHADHPPRRVMLSRTAHRFLGRLVAMKTMFPTAATVPHS